MTRSDRSVRRSKRSQPRQRKDAPSLDDFIRHAERFRTTECLFETAEQAGLPPLELGYLARHLRRIDNRWNLEREQRNRLLRSLNEARLADREIREMTGVSQDTLSRFRKSLGEGLDAPLSPGTMRRKVRKLTWDNEYPYQTVSAYFKAIERLQSEYVAQPSDGETSLVGVSNHE